jgi:hypothetical protein
MAANQTLSAIAEWKLDAREESVERYFFALDRLAEISTGTASFVIGRKGSGKTAIAEHLHRRRDSQVFTTMLSFKAFPFNSLYQHADSAYPRPNQYTTLWRHVLCSTVCSMLGRNEAIANSALIRKAFDLDLETALGKGIESIASKSVTVSVLGTGGGMSYGTQESSTELPWHRRADELERFMLESIDDSSYYILFDELDEDYRLASDPRKGGDYFDLITGLFKAVQQLRRACATTGARIYPIIFLRDDIFDRIRDPDKNKWMDAAIELEWDEPHIKAMLSHRIARASSEYGSPGSFESTWSLAFEDIDIRYGRSNSHRRSIFKHIQRTTLMRPRDFVHYIRQCAIHAITAGHTVIAPNDAVLAEHKYSEHLRREFVDELHTALPQIEEILNVFSTLRKPLFRVDEFKGAFFGQFRHTSERPDLDDVLKTLFEFSVIGNVPRQTNRPIFRYQERKANLSRTEGLCLHRGLLKALAIY